MPLYPFQTTESKENHYSYLHASVFQIWRLAYP